MSLRDQCLRSDYFENYDFTFYLNSASGGWKAEICNTKTIGEYKSEYIWILELIQIRIIFGLKIYAEYRDSKSGERGEHVRAIFLPLLC